MQAQPDVFAPSTLGDSSQRRGWKYSRGGARPLAKVAITGGGRCNLTNSFSQITDLRQAYPRGDKLLKRAFRIWNHEQTMEWFRHEGVPLVTQEDECVFPQSQDAMQIVNTLLRGMKDTGVTLHLSHRVTDILPQKDGYVLRFADERIGERTFDIIICTIGGCPRMGSLSLLHHLDIEYIPPVPSLFTLKIADSRLTDMMGTVVESTQVSLAGSKLKAEGPLLITHWGVSGPAILKLSSYGARLLAEAQYRGTLCVNWLGGEHEEAIRGQVATFIRQHSGKQLSTIYPRALTAKLWTFLLQKCQISPDMRWNELSGKKLNRLIATLTADTYPICGRGQYKEEFVTCGGVALSSIDLNTLEVKKHPGCYLAGEVLDVDAITGGFNLQAAWSMAYQIADNLRKRAET